MVIEGLASPIYHLESAVRSPHFPPIRHRHDLPIVVYLTRRAHQPPTSPARRERVNSPEVHFDGRIPNLKARSGMLIIRKSRPGDMRGIVGPYRSRRVISFDNSSLANLPPLYLPHEYGLSALSAGPCADLKPAARLRCRILSTLIDWR